MRTSSVEERPADDFGFKVITYEQELDRIAGWVLGYPDRETGGDLFGFWTHSGSPAVQLVLGPGPEARHQAAAFFQDTDYLSRAGLYIQERHGLQHIGEWHSHHRLGLDVPSTGDAATLRHLFAHTAFPRFLLCIATIRDRDARDEPQPARRGMFQRVLMLCSSSGQHEADVQVEIGAFLFERARPGYRRGLWVVLPDASPLAEATRQSDKLGPSSEPCRAWRVSQTTLDDNLAEKRAPPPGWYTQGWGAAFLRRLDSLCRESFTGCGMSLANGTGELSYRFRSARGDFVLWFPTDFPGCAATLDGPESPRDELAAEPGEDGSLFFARLAAIALPSAEPDPNDEPTRGEQEERANELE